MTNLRTPKVVERRVLIILLRISALEAIPLVESLAGVHITGFWRSGGGGVRWERTGDRGWLSVYRKVVATSVVSQQHND
jgi:hypothetical protein